MEFAQPVGIGLGVIIQQRDEFTLCDGDPLIVGGAKPAVFPIADHLHPEFLAGDVRASIGGAVIHNDRFEGYVALARQRG